MDIKRIIELMHNTLQRTGRASKLTALKELQEEEKGEPLRILIGTILSARTRDENTTVAVQNLFNRFKNVKELADASIDEIEQLIKPVGFYKVKARRIKHVASMLINDYNGNVPDSLEELLKLPGVGRKTANCVLVYAFDKPAIPVDTHVHRISNRLGLVETRDPEETEQELMHIIIDKQYWKMINDTFVMFGQNVCKPIAPLCKICLLRDECKYYKSKKC